MDAKLNSTIVLFTALTLLCALATPDFISWYYGNAPKMLGDYL